MVPMILENLCSPATWTSVRTRANAFGSRAGQAPLRMGGIHKGKKRNGEPLIFNSLMGYSSPK